MELKQWFSQLSGRQRSWLLGTVVVALAIAGLGVLTSPAGDAGDSADFDVDMSIGDIAPKLSVTGKALARELGLPLDVSKKKPLSSLGVEPEELEHATEHLLSHRDAMLKYYVFAALVLFGTVFLRGWAGRTRPAPSTGVSGTRGCPTWPVWCSPWPSRGSSWGNRRTRWRVR